MQRIRCGLFLARDRLKIFRKPKDCLQKPPMSVVCRLTGAGWSSLAARRAHNPKVVGSNPTPATNKYETLELETT